MTPDELWEKYKQPGSFDGFTGDIVCRLDFLAALKEYRESVRQQAVRVCRETGGYTDECAAAIENMEIK